MTGPEFDHAYLGNVAPDQIAALVFELASQLHVERQHRVALEVALEQSGVLAREAVDRAHTDKDALARGEDALDRAVRRMLRIVSEDGSSLAPLRSEFKVPL